MSTTPETVACEPLADGREVEARVIGTIPRPHRPGPLLRVEHDGATYRVEETDVQNP